MTTKIAPGLRQYLPFGGSAARARRDPLGFYLAGLRNYGDVFRYQIGPVRLFLLSHPDHIKHVLQDHQKNYPRSWFYNFVKLALGEGLVTSDGDFWLRQRRLAQPAFHRQRLAGFVTTMTDAATTVCNRWEKHALSGTPLNVAAEMMRLTLAIAGQTLFSVEIGGEADKFGQALTRAINYVDYRINIPWAVPVWFPTPRTLRFRRALRQLDQLVYDIIARQRNEGIDRGDLLSMLLAARDEETGEGMSDRQLRDEAMTFITAGHETTAVCLAWTWYLLSKHPGVERPLRAELSEVLGGRTPTLADLPKLKYTRMVIEESLRLYPPVWGMMRDAAADDAIGGFHIPKKSVIVLCQYVTHRHPAFWENPEGFDPERFKPELAAQRPRYAYFPFAGGPHQCIGNDFALLETTLVLATLAQRFRLHLVPGHPIDLEPTLTLRPRYGIQMTVHRT